MKRIVHKYSLTFLVLIVTASFTTAYIITGYSFYFYVCGVLWALTAFLADFVINFQIKQKTEDEKYIKLWQALKDRYSDGYLTNEEGDAGTKMKTIIGRLENKYLKSDVQRFAEKMTDAANRAVDDLESGDSYYD